MLISIKKGDYFKKRALMALLASASKDLKTKEEVYAGQVAAMQLTEEEADRIFNNDIVVTIVEVKKKI